MPQSITTPASLDEAEERLTDLEQLLTSKGWERAAILATFIRLPGSGTKTGDSLFTTADQFAKRRIPGLRDATVIRTYVQRWLDANAGKYPAPGKQVKLPVESWPPVDPGDSGSRATPTNVERQVRDNPEIAAAAVRGLETGGLEHVDDPSVEKLVHHVARTRREPTQAGILRETIERLPEAPFDTPPVIPGVDTTWMDVDRTLSRLHDCTLELARFVRERRDVVEPRAWRIEAEVEQLQMVVLAARGVDEDELENLLETGGAQ